MAAPVAIASPTAVVIGAVAKYHSRVAPPHIQPEVEQFGDFNFHDGILTAHREYLYGYSEGQRFIMGKKILGYKYTGWEEEYERFERTESVTFTDSSAPWSVKGNPSTNLTLFQFLLWLVLGVACAVLLAYLGYKIFQRLSHKKRDKREEILTTPGCDIVTEYSATASNRIWRNTLLPMYREQKCEMLSLSTLEFSLLATSTCMGIQRVNISSLAVFTFQVRPARLRVSVRRIKIFLMMMEGGLLILHEDLNTMQWIPRKGHVLKAHSKYKPGTQYRYMLTKRKPLEEGALALYLCRYFGLPSTGGVTIESVTRWMQGLTAKK